MATLTHRQPVVRDLWALRLQKLQSRATYDSETDTEAQRSEMFSSQSEGESGTDAATLNSRRSRQASRKKSSGPRLVDLVCLECIGAMLLKIPLTVADLHKWVNDGELLYYRAAQELPLSMRIHLPGHLQEQLEPQSIISPDTIHRNVMVMLSQLQTDFGMAAPSLNHPLVLYRWMRELSLPIEVFVAAQRLGSVLELDYSYNLGAKAGSNQSLRYPEIRLMALVVITTELLFPFDDHTRYPSSLNDLAVLKMDWTTWTDTQNESAASDNSPASTHLPFSSAFSMTEAESINLDNDSLDQYLEWCEHNIASEEIRDRGRAGRDAEFRRALFNWFPSSDQSGALRAPRETGDTSEKLEHKLLLVQQTLRSGRIVQDDSDDDIPRAGTSHPQYRSTDELQGTSKAFYQKASKLAGFSLHGMVRAVFLLETQMLQREKVLRKRKQERT